MSGKSATHDCHRPLSARSPPAVVAAAPLTAELEGPNALGSTGASFETHNGKKDSTSIAEYHGAQAADGEQPTEVSGPCWPAAPLGRVVAYRARG